MLNGLHLGNGQINVVQYLLASVSLTFGINLLSSALARKDVHANYSTTGLSGTRAKYPLNFRGHAPSRDAGSPSSPVDRPNPQTRVDFRTCVPHPHIFKHFNFNSVRLSFDTFTRVNFVFVISGKFSLAEGGSARFDRAKKTLN